MTFHDVTEAKEEVTVKPIGEQDEWESRRLWCAVAKGIREGDFETASREKSCIEVSFSGLVADRLFLLLMVCMYRTNNASGGGMKLLPRRLGN
jgi:hypothetical protein